MEAADVVAVIERLDEAGVPAWVDGGWGIDALVGERTRAHDDLDVVVPRTALAAARAALRALGYERDAAAEPGLPARLVLVAGGGRQVDLHIVELDADGNGWQPLGDGAWGAYPAEGLKATGAIGGRRVRCITPALQLLHHLGYPPRDHDRHDLGLLGRHFGIALPPASDQSGAMRR